MRLDEGGFFVEVQGEAEDEAWYGRSHVDTNQGILSRKMNATEVS